MIFRYIKYQCFFSAIEQESLPISTGHVANRKIEIARAINVFPTPAQADVSKAAETASSIVTCTSAT